MQENIRWPGVNITYPKLPETTLPSLGAGALG